jgi:predicted PurR-regulated permease PerM
MAGFEGYRSASRVALLHVASAGCLILLYWLRNVVLMCVIALLLALILASIASLCCRFLRLPRAPAVILSALLLLCAMAGTVLLIVIPLLNESAGLMDTMKQDLTAVAARLEKWEHEYLWLSQILPHAEKAASAPQGPTAAAAARTAFITLSGLLDGAADALAIFFLAIFLAWNPDRYLQGIAELGPPETTAKRLGLYRQIGDALRGYLFTYGIYILAMGALWAIGLWLMGLPYFLVFGVLGGLAEVAPYIGPFLALIPPLVVTLATSPDKAIYLLGLYVVLHIVEGYVLVPWLMHEREHLPPAMIILSLLVCGTLFGTLGVLLAVPIATMVYVIADELIYRPRRIQGEKSSGAVAR